ncbi:MAG TPA: histidinol-phosphate transaminase [Gemmataceae bacterium]|jgi:threonine-phosphate decarboxylase
MSLELRSLIRDVPLAVHGAPDHEELRRLGFRPADMLDFSSNINAHGPSPTVRDAIARTPLDHYPDNEALALRAVLAEHLGVSSKCILVGNGSSELIWLAALAFLRPSDRALVLGPTYAEYARMAALMGARSKIHLAQEKNQFALSLPEIHETVGSWQPRLVFLCNPNNPTGTVLDSEVIAYLANKHPHTLFIVDESYFAFATGLDSAANVKRENVLAVRAMTKDHALAGLRLGYAVGKEEWLSSMARMRPPWSVSALAQAAGIAALRDGEHLRRSLQLLNRAKGALTDALTELGIEVLPSAVHFLLVRVGNGAAIRRALLHKGILVRDCASFGLPEYIRICTRRPEENARLVAALAEVTHAG